LVELNNPHFTDSSTTAIDWPPIDHCLLGDASLAPSFPLHLLPAAGGAWVEARRRRWWAGRRAVSRPLSRVSLAMPRSARLGTVAGAVQTLSALSA